MRSKIEKIEVNESILDLSLEWISKKNYGLNEHQLTECVRFLLKKVVELEQKINEHEN